MLSTNVQWLLEYVIINRRFYLKKKNTCKKPQICIEKKKISMIKWITFFFQIDDNIALNAIIYWILISGIRKVYVKFNDSATIVQLIWQCRWFRFGINESAPTKNWDRSKIHCHRSGNFPVAQKKRISCDTYRSYEELSSKEIALAKIII